MYDLDQIIFIMYEYREKIIYLSKKSINVGNHYFAFHFNTMCILSISIIDSISATKIPNGSPGLYCENEIIEIDHLTEAFNPSTYQIIV